MKNRLHIFAVVFLLVIQNLAAQQIRVACIGNGMTYGTGINKRELNSYPAQLQRMLGEFYLVRNFGVEGATIFKEGEKGYTSSNQFQQSLDFEPEIIIFSFGMEEAKNGFAQNKEKFIKDYKELIFRYFNLPTALRIIILKPAPSFDTFGTLKNEVLYDEVIPAIEEIAYDASSEIIDTYSLLSQGGPLFSDNINLSAIGANRISRTLFETLNYRSEHDFNFVYEMGIESERSNFHGFAMNQFEVFGWETRLVSPKNAAIGRPWVWKAGNWDQYNEIDLQLLQRGFHVAYIDTEGKYGSLDAIDRWERFYDLMMKGSMAKEMVIEASGISSLVAMNWAIGNQEKIKGIYLDEPLLNLNSWPKGVGKSEGDQDIWKEVLREYGMKSGKKEQPFNDSPVDYVEGWKNNQIPFFISYSKSNKQFVPEENALQFAEFPSVKKQAVLYAKQEAEGSVGIADPTEVTRFLLEKSGFDINFAAIPAAGFEYRPEAGWRSGADWWDNHREIANVIKSKRPQIIFLGNSITQGIGGTGRTIIKPGGGDLSFNSAFSNYSWVNAGISGDRIGQMMYRVTDGEYVKGNARLIVITAGVNDFPEESAANIAKGIQSLVNLVENKMPDVKVLLLGPLPAGTTQDHPYRQKYEAIHEHLAKVKWGDFVTYKPFYKEFVTGEGRLNPTYYSEDGIHLKPKGYEMWSQLLQPEVAKILE